MAERGQIRLDDPLSKYAPPGARVPTYNGQPIRLINLATHTSSLPRSSRAANRIVRCLSGQPKRIAGVAARCAAAVPGTQAAYSNLAFDLLGDALAKAAGMPYPALLQQLVTRPLGMKDTTFTPSPDQCQRLMIAEKGQPVQ